MTKMITHVVSYIYILLDSLIFFLNVCVWILLSLLLFPSLFTPDIWMSSKALKNITTKIKLNKDCKNYSTGTISQKYFKKTKTIITPTSTFTMKPIQHSFRYK